MVDPTRPPAQVPLLRPAWASAHRGAFYPIDTRIAMSREREADIVYKALLRYGLSLKASQVPHSEEVRQKRIILSLLEENPYAELVDAIQYGMPNVWPFSTDGRAFAAGDLEQNLLKARAEAAAARREGRVAYRPRGKR